MKKRIKSNLPGVLPVGAFWGIDRPETLKRDILWLILIEAVLGGLVFILFYGHRILDVGFDDWLMTGGDMTQHYLGWKYFRVSDWQFPIGMMDGLSYPYSISLSYFDAIPLFSLFFKLLSPLLPETFQFWGLWGLSCLVMNAIVSGILIRSFCKNKAICVIASMFFILSSVVFRRLYGQEALAAHWLILSALAIWVYKPVLRSFRITLSLWCSLFTLCVLIHPYFLPMVGIFFFFSLLDEAIQTKKWFRQCILLLCPLVCVLVVMYCLGVLDSLGGRDAGGLGIYCANLNAFFSPMGGSTFFKDTPTALPGQGEGIAYLGAGMFLMGGIALYNFASKGLKEDVRRRSSILCMALAVLCSCILGFGPVVTANTKELFTIPYPEFILKVLNIFRASGRLIWPAYYVLFTLFLYGFLRFQRTRRIVFVLLALLCLQTADIWPLIHGGNYRNQIEYVSSLHSDAFEELAAGKKHVILKQTTGLSQSIIDIADYAWDHDLTMSTFYIAENKSTEQLKSTYYELLHSIEYEKSDSDSLIFFQSDYEFFELPSMGMWKFYKIDGLYVGTSTPLVGTYADVDVIETFDRVSIPMNENFLINGSGMPGDRRLSADGILFGPYISIPQGRYRVEIQGDGLDKVNFDVLATMSVSDEETCDFVPLTLSEQNEKQIVYGFEASEDLTDVEIRISNSSDVEISLYEIVLIRE